MALPKMQLGPNTLPTSNNESNLNTIKNLGVRNPIFNHQYHFQKYYLLTKIERNDTLSCLDSSFRSQTSLEFESKIQTQSVPIINANNT